MKTKFFKLLLPAFAILMAVGLAFATEESPVVQQGYYFLPGVGWQTVMVEENCSDEGTVPCEINGNQLYSQPDFASIALRKN